MRRKNYFSFLVALVVVIAFSFIPGRSVQAAGRGPLMWVDSPNFNATVTGDISIAGWALNESGVSKVNIYLDGQILGQAQIGLERPDVNTAFPGYPGGDKSGYTYLLRAAQITAGIHNITVEAVGINGTSQKTDWKVTIQKTPIIASPSATQAQAEVWARSKGATTVFVGLAEKYWRLASQRGNIDPAVAYAQAAKETGFGKFGGVIDETYNNPCGLKTTQGGTDGDPTAHMKFKDWEEGVTAHLDHLALYAGAAGYPRTDTPDPRHFSSLKGKGYSVEALGGAWAPSPTYGTEIIAMVNAMKSAVQPQPAKMWIETPGNGYSSNTSFTVAGWALNSSGVKGAVVKVDDQLLGNAVVMANRGDVNTAFKGYPTGSSFVYDVDINKVAPGWHALTVEVSGEDGSKSVQKIDINIVKPLPKVSIEVPPNGYDMTKSTTITGWALNVSGVKEVNIKVDGEKRGTAIIAQNRTEINKTYQEYPTAWGFTYELDFNKIGAGNHNITAEAIGNDGSKAESTVSINVNKPVPRMWVETPTSSIKLTTDNPSAVVYGWALNASDVKEVNILIDGVKKDNAFIQSNRGDVNTVFKGYPTAVSLLYNVDINNLMAGNHVLAVEAVGNDGSKTVQSFNLTIDKPAPLMWVETPANDSKVKSNTSISGWILSQSNISSIDIIVDGVKRGQGIVNGYRPDVNTAIKGYPIAKAFGSTLDLTAVKPGLHTVVVEMCFTDGSKVSQTIKINKNIVYAIDIGHNAAYDTGATGIRKEDDLTKEIGLKVEERLVKEGYEVIDVLPKTATSVNDSLQQRVDKANAANVDYFVSIHFNVYNGQAKGTEVYSTTAEGKNMAQKVVDNIAALGYTNRGVKSSDFFVLVNTKAPSILIEGFFIDNQEDMNRYNPTALTDAIVRGIMK